VSFYSVAVSVQPLRDTGAFKLGIESPLDDIIREKGMDESLRHLFTLSEVNRLYLSSVDGIRKKQISKFDSST